jgi:hypothetical protein
MIIRLKDCKGKTMDINLNDFVKGFIYRDVKKLYLNFLYLIEDLKEKDQISEEEFQRFRKRILDYGNNCYRNIEEQLNSFDFNLNKK